MTRRTQIVASKLVATVAIALGAVLVAGCTTTAPAASSGASSTSNTSTTGSQADAAASGTQTSLTGDSDHSAPGPSATPPPSQPVRTTPVPPPSPGKVNQTAAVGKVSVRPSVPLTAKASFGGKVTASLVKIASIKTEAKIPGEIAGPGLAVTLQIQNGSSKEINLSDVTVDLRDSKGAPAVPIVTSNEAKGFSSGALPANRSANATFVFSIPSTMRAPISVRVSYTTEAPTVLFVGDAQ